MNTEDANQTAIQPVAPETLALKNKPSIWSQMADLAKRGIAANKARVERNRAERREKQRVANIERFRAVQSQVLSAERLINTKAVNRFKSIEDEVQGDDLKLVAFIDHELTKKVVERIAKRRDFEAEDKRRHAQDHIFTTYSGHFLSTLDQSNVRRMLDAISQKYMVSTFGSSLATGILAGRKNYGGAAMVAADTARIKYRNGVAKGMFTDVIRVIQYDYPASSMANEVRKAIITANRLLYFREGDANRIQKALFSLIYYNGNASPIPPQPYNEFSSNLHPEFHNAFRGLMLTVQQAILEIDAIVQQKEYTKRLAATADISPFFRDFTDALPAVDAF